MLLGRLGGLDGFHLEGRKRFFAPGDPLIDAGALVDAGLELALDPVLEHGHVALQPRPGLGDPLLERQQLRLKRAELLRGRVQRTQVLTSAAQRGKALVDLRLAFDRLPPIADPTLEIGAVPLRLGPALHSSHRPRVELHTFGPSLLELRHLAPQQVEALGERGDGDLGRLEPLVRERQLRAYGVAVADALLQAVDRVLGRGQLTLHLPAVQLRALLETIVQPKSQHVGEHLLALGGSRHGEQVRSPLDQERAVHERVVVHSDESGDVRLRRADRVSSDGTVLRARGHAQLERALCATARLGVATHGFVALAAHVELELDDHLFLAVVQQLLLALPAGPAPQRPGDGIE